MEKFHHHFATDFSKPKERQWIDYLPSCSQNVPGSFVTYIVRVFDTLVLFFFDFLTSVRFFQWCFLEICFGSDWLAGERLTSGAPAGHVGQSRPIVDGCLGMLTNQRSENEDVPVSALHWVGRKQRPSYSKYFD